MISIATAKQLRVGRNVRLAENVHVELEVLAQPALLLSLVAKELGHREPPDGLPQRVRARGDHASHRWRHLRPQRDLAIALVLKVVELSDDLVAALLRVQVERLERRPVVFREREPARHIPPRSEDVRSLGELGGVEIAKPWQRSCGHPWNLPVHGIDVQARHGIPHSVE